ncbi:transmembrane protein, putative [Medicago truncatula]|uniref:Transmembrane protein, putative n=1 Tax=Medicago truncatula TaxID=3880 RepID=G7JXG9_MEDTR|nr:transmembrane protein, putative [Medicago truncatula]
MTSGLTISVECELLIAIAFAILPSYVGNSEVRRKKVLFHQNSSANCDVFTRF